MSHEITRWPVKPLHRSRRGADERLLLAMPWLGRGLVSATVRAPAGSPLRRAALTHLISVVLAAAGRGDYWAAFAFLAPDIELYFEPEPESRPAGLDPVYYGAEGYVKALDIWTELFSEHRWDLHELVDPGGARIGARIVAVGRGAGSGVEVRLAVFYVWQFKRGLVWRQWALQSEEAMLAVLEAGMPKET